MSFPAFTLTDSYFLNANCANEIDKEHDTCTVDLLSRMKTYTMEFDLERSVGKTPKCFVRELGNVIAPYIILRDPNQNELEVHVVRKYNKIYFENGWHDLKDIYHIPFGAWVTFTYVNPKLLNIKLINRWGEEVQYPNHDPPFKRLLDKAKVDSSNMYGTSHSYLPPLSFVRTYVKKMTTYDVHSGTLIMPWSVFGDGASAFNISKLVLVDYIGHRFHCKAKFVVDGAGELFCMVSNGWIDLCRFHRLVEGDKVRFCVSRPTPDYTVYVCLYPQIGIETTLSYPLSDGSCIPISITQQYFLTRG